MSGWNWTAAFKGAGGTYEVNRFIGGVGGLAYIFAVPLLVAYEVIVRGAKFELVSFCAAYPAGLGVVVAATAGAVALKDRSVAKAKTETAAAAVVQAEAEGRT